MQFIARNKQVAKRQIEEIRNIGPIRCSIGRDQVGCQSYLKKHLKFQNVRRIARVVGKWREACRRPAMENFPLKMDRYMNKFKEQTDLLQWSSLGVHESVS
ncbi:hypothetical protein D3C71_1511010 [compost metagenome]